MKKAKILFIEDSTDLQEAVALSLSKEYEIHAAVDAEAALLMFDKVHYDLLIVDLGLPKMSGYKLCTIIRSQEKNSQVPIIIYSNFRDRTLSVKFNNTIHLFKRKWISKTDGFKFFRVSIAPFLYDTYRPSCQSRAAFRSSLGKHTTCE